MLCGNSFIIFVARLEYQARQSISGASSFKNLLARLPPRVHSVYYRDEIGNISSSHLRSDSYKVLDVSPQMLLVLVANKIPAGFIVDLELMLAHGFVISVRTRN